MLSALPLVITALALAAPDKAAPKTPARIEITADRMDVFGKDSIGFLRGHVVARRNHATLTCDKMTVHFDPDAKTVSRLICEGHVVIVSGQRRATGDQAELDNVSGIARLRGDPVVTEGQRRAAGRVIIYALDEERVSIEDPVITFPEEDTERLRKERGEGRPR